MIVDTQAFKAKARALVSQMTTEEKAGLCSGLDCWHTKPVERLGVPSVALMDGPHGLRKQISSTDNLGIGQSLPAVCFPTSSALACSFNRELLYSVGHAMGEACLQEEVSIILGPGANQKRSPLCGRNFEYYSEDPLVSGELAASLIQGIQSTGTGACLKHFAVNNQEKHRMTVNVVIDDRALRETYLKAFEIAVKKGRPRTVMSAYNKIGDVYCSENKRLLTDILRDEWGFDGLVVSDWNSVKDRAAGVQAGLDLEMPASQGINDAKLVAAVQSGSLPVQALDNAAARVTELALTSAASSQPGFRYDAEAHHRLATEAAMQSAVLLKNEGNLLPGSAANKAAVIGAFAKTPRYQGAGSSKINPIRIDTPLDALRELGLHADYADGYRLVSGGANRPQTKREAAQQDALIREACDTARDKDIVYIFAGLPEGYESEGFDRSSLSLPLAHNQLIEAVCAVNPNVAVILIGGAPMELPWLGRVKAVLMAYLGGEGVGMAVAQLLLGYASPSGKLAETWPLRLQDVPCHQYFPGGWQSVEYRESIYVGYRYYDKARKAVQFEFGHGLSYTSFAYSDIRLSHDSCAYGETIELSFCVTNTGEAAAFETAFIFCSHENSRVFMPVRELLEFTKTHLEPGETKRLSVSLDTKTFGYWNTEISGWYSPSGEYQLLVGPSSRQLPLSVSLFINSPEQPEPDLRSAAPSYYQLPEGDFQVSDAEFEALLKAKLPIHDEKPGRPFSMNNTLEDIRHTLIGKLVRFYAKSVINKALKREPEQAGMMLATLLEMPFFSLATSGELSEAMAAGIIEMANGNTLKGIRKLLG